MLCISRILKASRTITNYDLSALAQSHHHTPEDFLDGDIDDRIMQYPVYRLENVALSRIPLDSWDLQADLLNDYVERLKLSEPPAPILDPHYNIIDGTHRLNALAQSGRTHAQCWVGEIR